MSIDEEAPDRRALEARLAHLEKMESMGRLAGGIAHDFNNLLTAILGYVELLLNSRTPEDPDRSSLEQIQRAGQRAASLTQQLLAFSRKQVLQARDVDLNQTVLGLENMLTRLIREDIGLRCDAGTAPALVKVDPTQIEQAIINLVLNARDALPAGGLIRVDVSRIAAADVELPPDIDPAGAYVRVRVSDNGVGIEPGARPHLFEPFFTTKEPGKGTGLGLASVYGIVRQSHGWVDVCSEPGCGATFAMYFPEIAAGATTAPGRECAAEAPRGHETILLVEDEEAVRVVVATILRRQGYTVIETGAPLDAPDLFERHADDVDLLITDVVMPGLSGPALAQRLVALRPALRVLFISGYAGLPAPQIHSANVGFLSKPFESAALAARVREMLNGPATAPIV
jgi:two-component system, cell cycle sensor histidine kinase and response regulator CckA